MAILMDSWAWLSNLHWVWPLAFFILPLPLLARYFFPVIVHQQAVPVIPFASDFKALEILSSQAINKDSSAWRLLLASLIWLLFVVAVARPQWQGEPIEIPVSGRDLMLAIDISGSMETRDFEVSGSRIDRLSITKAIASDFLDRRQGDRVGLILFGSQAYVQVPLTFDLKTVKTLLNEAVIGLAGKETAIGDAIGLSVKRILAAKDASVQSPSKTDQVLILLTDGANNAGQVTPVQAAELAAQAGLKMYTIGIGASSMTVNSFFGSQTVNPSADLDEKTLRTLAEKTGGKYFRAQDTQQLLSIYKIIDELEPVEREKEIFRPLRPLYVWPLGIAVTLSFLLLLFMVVFSGRASWKT